MLLLWTVTQKQTKLYSVSVRYAPISRCKNIHVAYCHFIGNNKYFCQEVPMNERLVANGSKHHKLFVYHILDFGTTK